MDIGRIIIDDEKERLRSGWRLLIFIALLLSPRILMGLLGMRGGGGSGRLTASIEAIGGYALMIGWVMVVSWFCVTALDREKISSLGLWFFPGWWREAVRGLAVGAMMIGAAVLLQVAGGGTRLTLHPFWWHDGRIDSAALRQSFIEAVLAFGLLLAAATFEELLYRGYAFQTLQREAPAVVPTILFSLLFGLGHWWNPHRTFFSTTNTLLAGIWLSLAWLGSRNLWWPIGLHLGWNYLLGPVFGLPLSGISFPLHPLLLGSSSNATWLTGGDYGSEGGMAATIVLLVAIFFTGRRVIRLVTPTYPIKSP